MDRDHVVCRENSVLTPNQAQILVRLWWRWWCARATALTPPHGWFAPNMQKLFGVQMVQFKVVLESRWTREGGIFETLATPLSDGDDGSHGDAGDDVDIDDA